MSDDPQPTPPGAGNGAARAGAAVAACPCPSDFDLSAPCRIVRADGGRVTLTASDKPGSCSGRYAWTTSSSKIRLHNATSGAVTVEGLANVSAGRDAETVTVTRSQDGCADLTKTVKLTVARVTFRESANQRYGFDDFDTPGNHDDDHVSVKRGDHSFVRTVIEGGVKSEDFTFATDDAAKVQVVAPAAGQDDFDLRINGGAQDKASTRLKATVNCPSNAVFREIEAHVYKEREVKVVVAKVHDSRVAGTALRFPTADYAGHEATINDKVKEAVAKYDIQNFKADNSTSDVAFDADGGGTLSYDIASGGGAELTAISRAITGARTTGRIRIAVVRSMNSYYYLSAAAAAGDTTITVRGSVFHSTRQVLKLDSGAKQERVTVRSHSGVTLTLAAPLAKDHAAGATLEYRAGGWSSDPIMITEGSSTLDVIKWTVAHEAGHRREGLALTDIVDDTSFMHYSQAWTDYRLRYCPRTRRRGGGTQNQWETIPR